MIIIPLTQGKSAIIDDADQEKVKGMKWFAAWDGERWYARAYIPIGRFGKKLGIRRKRRIVRLHDIVAGFKIGHTVDHVDHDGLNCRRSNLRHATPSQQGMNQRIRTDNKTGFRGVAMIVKPYKATISFNKKVIHLGYFRTAVEAAKAYNEASRKYHGEFGYRNIIP